jgi:hypothetical protein
VQRGEEVGLFVSLFIAPHVGELDHLHIGALSVSVCVSLCLSVSLSIGLECVEVKPFWSDILFMHITMLKLQRDP